MKTTFEITQYLDQFVIGQEDAKKAIAVAYRERALKLANSGEEWKYVVPNNILMIGPSGTGKTELARQLAELTDAPFIKVEITEFTQVGYFGRDVKTILTDLVKEAIRIAPAIWHAQHSSGTGESLLEFLEKIFLNYKTEVAEFLKRDPASLTFSDVKTAFANGKFKKLNLPATLYLDMLLEDGDKKLSASQSAVDKMLEELGLNTFGKTSSGSTAVTYLNFIAMCINNNTLTEQKGSDFLQTVIPAETFKKLQQRAKSKLTDTKVRGVFMNFPEPQLKVFAEKLAAHNKIAFSDLIKEIKRRAPSTDEVPDSFISKLVEERGIVFIDEVDKIFVDKSGGNVGNIGVVRDLLPYLDGVVMDVPIMGERDAYYTRSKSTEQTYRINTANILWIASGAFNIAKVSDVPAEILGRLPVHVSLKPLDVDALYGILNKPHGSIIGRLKMLMEAEGVEMTITDKAVRAIAQLAFDCNQRGEDIGARRLISVNSKLFDQLRYDASNMPEGTVVKIDDKYVSERYNSIYDIVPVRVERFKPVNAETAILSGLSQLLKSY
jgi:ATP-dependent HslUV protease ATP-binding subunit HslU